MATPRLDLADLDERAVRFVRNALGQLGHDLNNLITPLTAYPGLVLSTVDGESKAATYARAMEKAAEDLARICERFILLSGWRAEPPSLCDVNLPVSEAIAEARTTVADTVAIEADLAPGLPPVRCARTELAWAVGEFIRNAAEAMPRGGRIRVGTGTADEPLPRTTRAGLRLLPGRYARITVQDNGEGIRPEDLDRVFDLFFSTKTGAGRRQTGTGLTIVRGIMQDHRGGIDAESRPGGGDTTFRLIVPVAPSPAANPTPAALPRATAPGNAPSPCNGGRILVVDDERSIRRLFEMILSAELPHYAVDVAENGAEALSAFMDRHHALVVMDLRMPVMDGRAAFVAIEEECRRRNWAMPSVVFCTGFAPPDSVRTVVDRSASFHALLAKPVSNEILLAAVRSRLECGPPAQATPETGA